MCIIATGSCGLVYYKLHGSSRRAFVQSDIICKQSRHEARRDNRRTDTPSAPIVSRPDSPILGDATATSVSVKSA
jgi:hypothetical protein